MCSEWQRSTQLGFINTARTGVLFLWRLKDLLQSPKAMAPAAQWTPKRVGVNWMTQSISIKDFKALIPPVCSGNWNQLQKAPPVGLLQIIAGRYQQWVEDGGVGKYLKVFGSETVLTSATCTVMPCAHLLNTDWGCVWLCSLPPLLLKRIDHQTVRRTAGDSDGKKSSFTWMVGLISKVSFVCNLLQLFPGVKYFNLSSGCAALVAVAFSTHIHWWSPSKNTCRNMNSRLNRLRFHSKRRRKEKVLGSILSSDLLYLELWISLWDK